MNTRQLGPIVGATLLHHNIDYVVSSYQTNLGYTIVDEITVSREMALLWSTPELFGNKLIVLSAANGEAWLRVVEDPKAKAATPLKSYGWMALETNVQCVDTINNKLCDESFTVIGEPAYLQVSDAIKAMQVIGPAGEVSYLTQIDKDVPPFELPMTEHETAGLFIPVLCTPNREKSLAFYQQLNAADNGLSFDTKVTVLNNAWGHDIEHQYPVATLQLDGKCLFEIDQVDNAAPLTTNINSLPSGIAMISCHVKNIEQVAKKFNATMYKLEDSYYKGRSAILLKGPFGELIELMG